MSLITQRSIFSTNAKSLIFESDPNTVDATEIIAIALGAERDSEDHHVLHFNNDSISQKALIALENIIAEISSSHTFKINIVCGNRSLYLEGDSNNLKALYATVRAFGKDIIDDTVIFDDDEINRFDAIQDLAKTIGIIPYC